MSKEAIRGETGIIFRGQWNWRNCIGEIKDWNLDKIKPKSAEALYNACTAVFNSRKLRPNDWGKVE